MAGRTVINAVLFAPLLAGLVDAQPANVRVNPRVNGDFYPPEEVSVAINPLNPMNIAASANVRYAYISIDGGASWKESLLPTGTWGDPSLAFDARGGLYYSHLTNYGMIGVPGAQFIDRLGVHRSSDGGFTWRDSVIVGYNPPRQQDKDYIVADITNSAYRNSLYLGWTQFDTYGSTSPSDSSRILCSRSTDGGATWGKNVFVDSLPGGWDQHVSGIYRCNGMPVTACDISNSANRGTVYVCWADIRYGIGKTRIFLRRSTDGGASWQPAVQVNTDGTDREHFFPWMTVDPLSGVVYVVYYDRRETDGDMTDVYVSRSSDGGKSFADFRVSATPFTPDSAVFFGDYTGIAARGGKVCPVWMRMDSGELTIWTAPFVDTLFVPPPGPAVPSYFALSQNYPNPFNPSTTIAYQIPRVSYVRLSVYDLLGREVTRLVDGPQAAGFYAPVFNATHLASGVYFYKLSAEGYSEEKSMVFLK